jgi:hypothetical protein
MEWDRLATLIFSGVAAAGALIAGYVNVSKHVREVQHSSKEEANRWSLEISKGNDDHWFLANLIRNKDESTSVRLRKIELNLPWSSLLVSGEWSKPIDRKDGQRFPDFVPVIKTAARTLVFDHDLKPAISIRGGHGVKEGYSLIRFFVSPPKLPRWTRSHSSRRVVIIVEAEEISSARRSMRIKVISQPIDWTASKPKAAS